jgi:hypothetical protein
VSPYNSNYVADHLDYAQSRNGFGYLLHKNPERMHAFELSFGKAHLFYPEETPERCTVALLLCPEPLVSLDIENGRGSLEHAGCATRTACNPQK